MDINLYKMFAVVAKTQNISYAASLLNYSQSGVSHAIKRLEKELQIQLFIRDRYGVRLTPVGSEFLIEVRKLLAVNEHLEQFIYDIRGLEVGTINIASYANISVNLLPKIIASFRKNHKNIYINLKEGGIENINTWVLNGSVDFAFSEKQKISGLEFMPILKDRYVAIFSPDYPLDEDMESFPVKKFTDLPFIYPDPLYNENILNILKKEKAKPNLFFSSQDDNTIMSMVEQNLGVSLIPELVIGHRKKSLKYLPLDPPYHRQLCIMMRSFEVLSPAAKAFIYHVQDSLKLL